jgi:Flp pilus assembly protein TadG
VSSIRSTAVPTGTPRPARRLLGNDRREMWSSFQPRSDRGAVTVEAAIALLALVFLLAVLSWFLVVISAQLRIGDAARAAARVAARGESYAAVRAEARKISPNASVAVDRTGTGQGARVVVSVTDRMLPPTGMFSGIGAVVLRSEATALLETP